MDEEKKEPSVENQQEKKGKIIVIKKSIIVIAVVLVIVAVGIILWLFRPSGNAENIAEDSPILGSANATVYLIEFSDYECPFCQAAEGTNQEVIASLKKTYPEWEAPIPKVIEEYVNTGKVKLVFRQYPLHANSKDASLAAKCAQEQDKFWEYHKILFENYDAVTITDLKKYAVDLNLNLAQFNECLDSKKYEESINKDLNDGSGLGVSGTPTFFIGNDGKGYETIVGAQSFSVFKQKIDSKISV